MPSEQLEMEAAIREAGLQIDQQHGGGQSQDQRKGVVIVVKGRVKKLAGAAAPGHAEQEQHQNAHRNRQERPAPVRQLIPVFQQRTAQDQIAHGVPEVVAEEIDEPEKLPFVAHIQPQPPADKILDVVE